MSLNLLAPRINLLTSKLLTQIGQNRIKKATQRKLAIAIGLFYLTANIVGPIGFGIERPILNAQDHLASVASNETKWLLAGLAELVMALVIVGIAIAVYPILKKNSYNPLHACLGRQDFRSCSIRLFLFPPPVTLQAPLGMQELASALWLFIKGFYPVAEKTGET